ncbi:MAG TPA: ABC transporter permease [Acidimicrobiales bacterium]|jgi:peptide/nickel transport system permease protein|nr:ABC transporter permease [Acidimicrobiales bacterium]
MSGLGGRIGRQVVALLATLLAVSVLSFLLTSLLPGDPAVAILGPSGITQQSLASARRALGLDHPLVQRYWDWLGNVVHGNLGSSFITHISVSSELRQHLPVTLELIVLATIFSVVLAIPFGIWSGYRAGRADDRIISLLAFAGLAVPTFVVALMLILVCAVDLHWLPASGWVPLTQSPWQNFRSALLPALALALPQMAVNVRVLRSDVAATMQSDFVTFAVAKGLPLRKILFRHAFRPSSLSFVTVMGLQIGFLLGGTVIVENLFSLPGIGQMLVQSILSRDLITVQGLTLFIATGFVVINFVVDLAYSLIDPRIRRGRNIATV